MKFKGNWQKSQLKQGGYLKSGKTKNLKSRKFYLKLGGIFKRGGVFRVNTTVFHF